MTDEQRIQQICNEHATDGDFLWHVQLVSIANGLAQPSSVMNEVTAPDWMHELARLCSSRHARIVVHNYGNQLEVR